MAKSVTSTGETFQIQGLRDFAKAIKKVDERFPVQLRDANYDLAKEVSVRAQALAGTQGGVARKAAKSLRASKNTNQAQINAGGARYPYFFGAEFGAKRYKQFRPWRGNQFSGWGPGPGYFLHPAIRDNAQDLIDGYMKKLEELTRMAFPETGV